jgi:hypothetical protein
MFGGIQTDVLDCREETYSGEYADCTSLQQHIVMGEHLHRINSCRRIEGWRLVDPPFEELLPVVLDDWGPTMTKCEHLSWDLVDDILFESLGLTKASGIFHPYNQL